MSRWATAGFGALPSVQVAPAKVGLLNSNPAFNLGSGATEPAPLRTFAAAFGTGRVGWLAGLPDILGLLMSMRSKRSLTA